MLHQRLDALQRAGFGDQRLRHQPFVQHQRLARIGLGKAPDQGLAALAGDERHGCQRGETIGQVVAGRELLLAEVRGISRSGKRRKAEQFVAQRPPSGGGGIRAIGAARRKSPAQAWQIAEQGLADRARQFAVGGEDRIGIDVATDLAGDVGRRRQAQHLRGEGRIGKGIALEEDLQGFAELAGGRRQGRRISTGLAGGHEHAGGDALERLPAVEGIAVGREQPQQVGIRQVEIEPSRGGEATHQRGDRRFRDILEGDR